MIELRPYQSEAVQALYDYFSSRTGNPLIVLPTGTGKSIVIAKFVHDAIAQYPDTRILMVTHVKELIAQNFSALLKVWPDAPAGIYSAGLGQRNLHAQVLFCGIQSVHKRAEAIQRCDLALIDEAHLIPRTSSTMYRRFLDELTAINPWLKVVGFTATPYRLDSGMLHRGDDALFTDIAYEANLGGMVTEGYLSPITSRHTNTELDTSGVHKRGGEFIAGELEEACNIDETNRQIVAEVVDRGSDRGSWLFFCTGVAHANAVRDLLREHVTAECIFGDTPSAERGRIISAFKDGKLRALVNVNVLTTGFDAPGIDLIADLAPTASTGRYVQKLGRGTRLAEGKDNCLVLDFAGNIRRHGPADAVDPHDPGKREEDEAGDAPIKVCPECEAVVYAGCMTCPECGYKFPPPEIKLSKRPENLAVLMRDIDDEWIEVTGVTYAYHEKAGSPPSMRVEYACGMLNTYREWVCIEHTGYAREKAIKWWQRRAPGAPVPTTTAGAIIVANHRDVLATPTAIQVQQNGQYTNVVSVRF